MCLIISQRMSSALLQVSFCPVYIFCNGLHLLQIEDSLLRTGELHFSVDAGLVVVGSVVDHRMSSSKIHNLTSRG